MKNGAVGDQPDCSRPTYALGEPRRCGSTSAAHLPPHQVRFSSLPFNSASSTGHCFPRVQSTEPTANAPASERNSSTAPKHCEPPENALREMLDSLYTTVVLLAEEYEDTSRRESPEICIYNPFCNTCIKYDSIG